MGVMGLAANALAFATSRPRKVMERAGELLAELEALRKALLLSQAHRRFHDSHTPIQPSSSPHAYPVLPARSGRVRMHATPVQETEELRTRTWFTDPSVQQWAGSSHIASILPGCAACRCGEHECRSTGL
ncbi:hypothetical protein L7F22_027979 [Adiantum nelumboides]|nr:hypothetical protein [Adiantum nelumboides]